MNSIDIANQIAAAAAPLVVAPAVAVAAPLVVAVPPAQLVQPVAVPAAPAVNEAALVASAAADGIVVQGATTTPVGPEQAPALTRAQQLQADINKEVVKRDAAIKRIETLTAKLNGADTIDKVAQGSVIVVQLGRAETSRQVRGVVTGIKVDEAGNKKFKVLVGEGFDASTEVVNEGQLIAVES